jgi:hypothetical protein
MVGTMVGLGLRMTGSSNSGATNGWDNGWVGATKDWFFK